MLIGLAIATFLGIKTKKTKKNIIGMIVCFATYIICELVSNMGVNYLRAIITMFIGTIAMGGFIGFLIGLIVTKIKK